MKSMVPTPLARLSPTQARWVLVGLSVAVLTCVAVSLSPLAQGYANKPRGGPGNDIELYGAEADRISKGESYYAVLADELPQRGYPTRSVFNWRTPLPVAMIGSLPDPMISKVLLCGLALCALLLAFEFAAREGGRVQSAICALLMTGAFLPCLLGDLFVMPVLWAGTLIVLSVSALGVGRRNLGIACGIAAVFFRDMAGPYCVFGLAMAVWQRRFKDALLWTAGLSAYGIFFGWHCLQVMAVRAPDAAGHAEGWVQFGGAAFVISTIQMNGFLLVLPQWISAIYLPLALVGFSSWSSRAGQFAGLLAVAYIVLFAIIGQPFNQYWGSLLAPLLCLGAARAPLALYDLWTAARVDAVGSSAHAAS